MLKKPFGKLERLFYLLNVLSIHFPLIMTVIQIKITDILLKASIFSFIKKTPAFAGWRTINFSLFYTILFLRRMTIMSIIILLINKFIFFSPAK